MHVQRHINSIYIQQLAFNTNFQYAKPCASNRPESTTFVALQFAIAKLNSGQPKVSATPA